MLLSDCALATTVVGRAQCMLIWLPGVQCFLRQIGAAGFWVNWALCQEALQLGWVVFRRTHGSQPSPLLSAGVATMSQNGNYQLDTTKLGRKRQT
jgi:hypothetical protein